MSITAHVVIKNEDVWIWFALQSILPYVDKVLVCINGSTDKTEQIVRSIKSPKIEIEVKEQLSAKELVDVRNNQIKKTKTDWILIVDGDEIWPNTQLEKLLKVAKDSPKGTIAFINKARNCIGDVFHYLPEDAGDYKIGKYKGNLNIRLIRKTNDLEVLGEYPLEAYTNEYGSINTQSHNLVFVDCWYLHTGFLKRSTMDKTKTSCSLGKKKTWEKGLSCKQSQLPESLFLEKPSIVPNPLQQRGLRYEILAFITSPILKIKRKFK